MTTDDDNDGGNPPSLPSLLFHQDFLVLTNLCPICDIIVTVALCYTCMLYAVQVLLK